MDGHVSFLDQNIDPVVMRRLVSAYEGIALFDPPSYNGQTSGTTNTPVNTTPLKAVDY